MPALSRSFHGRRRTDVDSSRIPPGQYVTPDFSVLSAGPTPHTPLAKWTFTIRGAVDKPISWTWDEFRAPPSERIMADIHCVTKWSKLDTSWTGVSVDTLLASLQTEAEYVLAFSDGGYTTNLPLDDLMGGRAWVAYAYDGKPLEPEHGGPECLLVPHLHFWKSAKWVRGLKLLDDDEPGFWEGYGYHNYGPVERTALRRRLNWQVRRVVELITETPETESIVLNLPDWFGQLLDRVRICTSCGTRSQLAELKVYLPAPGVVARCNHCDNLVMVIVKIRGISCVDVPGFIISATAAVIEPIRQEGSGQTARRTVGPRAKEERA